MAETLGIIHGGAQNEPRTKTFELSESDYYRIADMGEFNESIVILSFL